MNRSLFFSIPPFTSTPKTAGEEFLKTKSRIVNLHILGSSSNFFLSLSCNFSSFHFSKSSINLYTTGFVKTLIFFNSSNSFMSLAISILKPNKILSSSGSVFVR